ncbi:hypothetical protein [Curtobacterium sp. VKM Ac-1376]|uniref:hypothetical protein n=1 Tax=Curtobacterium sp. VKM Ac-1376 TaxID=123312 RepID=UPI00188D469E|nr:hypothetical protein [Curtobacterium sp. VKM Ac-1376]MBF4615317.1 hypothetical protein [Curtobacterium sp. VKM Ac-1376]
MAAHRMPESDRPRRSVPAWVTAPPVDEVTPVERVAAAGHVGASGREARPAPAPSHAAHAALAPTTAVVSAADAPATIVPAAEPSSIASLVETDARVPDYPPQEDLLPPAPMSPSVRTVPFENPALPSATIAPSGALAMPVSPAAAVPSPAPTVPPVVVRAAVIPAAVAPVPDPAPAPAPPVAPTAPVAGQPRFSVPGLEHVVVEGTEPEPSGPIGYRTPRRFAHQQAAAARPTPPAPARSFDAVLHAGPPAPVAPFVTTVGSAPAAPVPPVPGPQVGVGDDPGLPTELLDQPVAATGAPETRRALGATPGAVLGAVAGIATIGLAAWWFAAPATVHGVGLALGVLALVLSIVTLRDRVATWQRPVALLGAVLGGVGTLVVLWAVADALLSLAGVALPDVTGTGTTPTLAP